MEEQIHKRMHKTLAALRVDLAKIRSGRAHLGLLDTVVVPCYGSDMPLAQVASVSVADTRTLVVSPWDKNNTAAIDKAIRDSDLGVSTAAAGSNIRVTLPPLSEERRRDLVKVISREGETARIAIRNIRRDSIADIKTQIKNSVLSEDEGWRLEQQMQKITDATIAEADVLIDEKKQELMTV